MTNILHHNRTRNRQQQIQRQQLQQQQDNAGKARAQKYFNDNRHQFIELKPKKPDSLFRYNKNKVNFIDRLNQRKQEQQKQQTIQQFNE